MVLILVLMEDTLRVPLNQNELSFGSLNPCFNGRYSQREWDMLRKGCTHSCLNPCFNGRYSQSDILQEDVASGQVLILVLMEDTLRVGVASKENRNGGLNPCFNGRYSQSNYQQILLMLVTLS